MFLKTVLTLLLAGLVGVSATNSSSSSSSDSGGGGGAGNSTSSSSSSGTGAGAGASSSSSSGTGANGAAASSSSSSGTGANGAGAGSSSSSGTGANGANGNGAASSSSGGGANGNGGTVDKNITADKAPEDFKTVKAALTLDVGTRKAADLHDDADFKNAFMTAVAAATGVPKADVFINDIVDVAGRLRQLSNTTAAGSKVRVDFSLKTATTPAAIQTSMDTALTVASGSSPFATAFNGAATVNIKADQVVVLKAPVKHEGKKHYKGPAGAMVYDNGKCTGTPATTAAIKVGGSQTNAVGSQCIRIYSCTEGGKGDVEVFTDAACSTGGQVYSVVDGSCNKMVGGTKSFRAKCGSAFASGGGASTSDASFKSFAGVVFGLIMGLVSLM